MSTSQPIESLLKTVVNLDGKDVPITLDDMKAIKSALLGYLSRSEYEDRDSLIHRTQGPPWIDSEGTGRLGLWVLGADDSQMILRFREPPGPDAAKAHVASLAKKDGQWKVISVQAQRIRVAR